MTLATFTDHVLDRVLAALPGARRNGSGWSARCPAHEDHNPSLSISVGADGRVLMTCHAGCATEAVVTAAGLAMADLFPSTNGNGTMHAIPGDTPVYHEYHDEAGTPVYRVVRSGHGKSKRIHQERYDAATRTYVGGRGAMDGVRRLPYRLVQVQDAIAQGRVVFVVEGEKDADTLSANGLVATCNSGGSGKWHADLTPYFKGARVAVIPDNDDPGRRHADDVTSALGPVAAEVRLVELPDVPAGGDVTDYFERGHDVEELKALVVAAAPRRPDGPLLVTASTVQPASPRWLLDSRIPLGAVSLLVGDPGHGKTTWALNLAADLTRGRLDGDLSGQAHDVVVASEEDSVSHTLVPRLLAAGADLDRVHILRMVRQGVDGGLVLPDDTDKLREAIQRTGARLAIVDPIFGHLSAEINSNSDPDMRRMLTPLALLAESMDVTVLGIAHLNKSQSNRALTRIGGSVALGAVARSVLLFGADPDADEDDATARVIVHAKNNLGPLAPTIRARVVTHEVEHQGTTLRAPVVETVGLAPHMTAAQVLDGDDNGDVRSEARAFLRETLSHGPVPQKDVMREARSLGISESTLRRVKKGLGVESIKSGFGDKAEWRWSLPSADTKRPDPDDPDCSEATCRRVMSRFDGSGHPWCDEHYREDS